MRKLFTLATLIGFLTVAVLLDALTLRAQSGETGYDLVTEVNNYRVSQGMPPLPTDAALMAAAQGHADWMAANHTSSHMGAGGSMPGDRAIAAGYVGGGGVRENVASGDLGYISVYHAVHSVWEPSTGHRLTMLMNATHIGAGTAWDNDTQYYVLLIGDSIGSGIASLDATMIAIMNGGPTPSALNITPYPGTLDSGTPAPTPYYVEPIVRATPDDDGTIIHTVGIGQTAWAIAAVYRVDLDDLLSLNGLQRPVILFPGDQLIVQLGPNATPPTPSLRTHTVQPGESAWTIAAIYGLTLDDLLIINGLQRPAILQPGDVLIVQYPEGYATVTPVPPGP